MNSEDIGNDPEYTVWIRCSINYSTSAFITMGYILSEMFVFWGVFLMMGYMKPSFWSKYYIYLSKLTI